MKMLSYILSVYLLWCVTACKEAAVSPVNTIDALDNIVEKNEGPRNYKINQPDLELTLPFSLIEISGLTYDNKEGQLVAINDEKGSVYRISPQSGEVLSSFKFRGKGDYEGVEVSGDKVYVLENDGQIFLIDSTAKKGSIKLRTDLREVNDVEGLGYDRQTHSLLLACKGNPSVSSAQKLKKTKAVYAFDLNKRTLRETPVMTISDNDIEAFLEQEKSFIFKTDKEKKNIKKRARSFSPSGIAQHPTDNEYYILSSVGKLLFVVGDTGDIRSISFLNEKTHQQPEGICFDVNNNLYISNEGKSGVARIYKFEEVSR